MKKCPYCGKDIEQNAVVCPHCTKSLLADVSTIKSVIEGETKTIKEQVAATDTRFKGLEDRLSKIEGSPLNKMTFNVNHGEQKWRNFNLADQGISLREKALSLPHSKRFKVLNDDAKANDFCKFFLCLFAALKGDIEAKAELKTLYQKAQMQEDTASEGGYLVPIEYDWDIIQLARAQSFGLNECTVLNMSSESKKVPKEASLVSVAWHAEESDITETEPTFGQLSLATQSLDGYGKITNELLQDSAMDIVSMLVEQFAYAIGQELDNQILNGTGSPCSGVLTSAVGSDVKFASGSTNFSAVSAAYLSQMIYALNTGYLANARYIINRITAHYVRSLADSNGRPIFQDMTAVTPSTIYGYPYFVSEKITNTSAAETAFAAFGNFKRFFIGRRIGQNSIDLDPYSLFTKRATQFRYITRWGLGIGNSAGFVRMLTATS